jgi:drug efflux transport system permease protein
MIGRIKRMLVKEFLQMLRDPRMRIVVFGAPVIQMTVLAFALTTDVDHIKIGLLDSDRSPASRQLVERLTSSGHFEIKGHLAGEADADRLLDEGSIRAFLHLPAGLENDLKRGDSASIQLLADGTDSNTASIVLAYASQVIQEYSTRLLAENIEKTLGPSMLPGRVEIEARTWFNPNLESKYYYVPGLIAVMLLLVSMLLASIAIVKEKEIGTIEQIMVTPISRLEFILGKTIPFMITGFITMTIMFIVAILIFGIRVHGSWLLLYVLTGVYLAGNLGLALLVSVSSSTQQQALLTAFLILMPSILLSGFMFPINNMPEPVQYATFLNPMRWYLEILRGVVMKGVGIESLWPAITAQSVLAFFAILTASLRFKKTLE